MSINNPDRIFYILIDLCLGNMSLLEITPTKLSNFYFPTFDHLICAYFRFLSLNDMIHIPWVLATWQEPLLSCICVSPNPFSRNIHTNPFIKSGPTHTSVSTCIYLYIYLDTIQERKHVSETARGSWASLNSFIICAGEWSPGKRTQTHSPLPDHPPNFGLVFSVFCHGEPYPGILQAFHGFFVHALVSPTHLSHFLWALSSSFPFYSSPWDDHHPPL